jgi:hypothetical protein
MGDLFVYCAVFGGSLLVLQFVLLALGAGGDTDHGVGGHDAPGHDQGGFLKLLSLQSISAFVTFFGLAGLATGKAGWSPLSTMITAGLAGFGSLFGVAWLLASLSRLQSSGTVDLRNSIGQNARVYVRIPDVNEGHGRVLVTVQGRTLECKAVSRGAGFAPDVRVRVVDVTTDDTLVVDSVPPA